MKVTDILLGSETYELTVTCVACTRTEIMYVPTSLDVSDVGHFLIGRGWFCSGADWVCPSEAPE